MSFYESIPDPPLRNGNMWTRLSIPMRITVSLLAIVMIVAIAVGVTFGLTRRDQPDLTPVTDPPKPTQPSTPIQPAVCLTESCKATAELWKANMDEYIHPCYDFYGHACGNFDENNELPGDKGQFTSFDKVTDEVKNLLIDKLSVEEFEEESNALKSVWKFFKRTTDEDLLEKNNFERLIIEKDKLKQLEETEDLVLQTLKTYAVPSLLSFRVMADPEDSKKRILAIDQPPFTLSKKDLTDEKDEKAKEDRQAYFKYINESLALIEGHYSRSLDKAESILKLEMALAGIAAKDEDRRDFTKLYKKYKKEDLKNEVKGIDLVRIINELDGDYENSTDVVVVDIEYFKKLDEVLKVRMPAVKNLMTWNLFKSYAPVVSNNFTDLTFQFLNVTNGLTKKPDVKETMLNRLISAVPNVMGRLYIDAAGFSNDDLAKVDSMVAKVKESMGKIIEEKEWMDEATKAAAKEKLNQMTVNMAYPEWIRDDAELDRSFDIKFSDKEDTFGMLFKLKKWLVDNDIKKLQEEVDLTREWPMSAALVDAAYSQSQNSITFPAAILRGVFYNSGRPDYANYAAIGTVIGHEITHGFDDQGAQFGPDGKLVDWWSNETKTAFKEAADKMVKQYSEIVDSRTGLHLNGINTQGENIADNGGVREAYIAYFSQKLNESMLPGFEDWSPEKMFFLSYANVWCGLITEESLRQSILNDHHAPGRYRVNVPLANSPEFAKAFNCKEGAKMNPKDRVIVW